MRKQARFIQILEMEKSLYALDEEGIVWRYEEESSTDGHVWRPLSSKRYEEPSSDSERPVGF